MVHSRIIITVLVATGCLTIPGEQWQYTISQKVLATPSLKPWRQQTSNLGLGSQDYFQSTEMYLNIVSSCQQDTTDRPESVRSTTTESIETGNIINDGEMPNTSGYIANVCITPESVRPFTKAEQRKNKCVPTKRQHKHTNWHSRKGQDKSITKRKDQKKERSCSISTFMTLQMYCF